MRFQHYCRWYLMKLGLIKTVLTNSISTILCSQCQRDCYVAYVNCSCLLHPVCLRHEIRSDTFPCGGSGTLCVREDLSEMEAAAKKFEQEKGFIQHMFENDDLYILPNTISHDDKHGYIPYRDISFQLFSDSNCVPDQHHPVNQTVVSSNTENIDHQMSERALASAASTLCSFHAPVMDDASRDNTVLEKFSLKKAEYSEVSRNISASSFSSPSRVCMGAEGSRVNLPSLQKLEVIPVVDQRSDDSDSEIFRVKRRSSIKAVRRTLNESSDILKHQGLKRLKRSVPDPKSRSVLVKNGEGINSSSDKSIRRSTVPLSIKMRKTVQHESLNRREHHPVNEKIQIATLKATTASASRETGRKRPKVRIPTFMEQ